MGLSTKNAGSLTDRGQNQSNGQSTITLDESVYIESIERDGEKGETVRVSSRDAKSLVGMKFAHYAKNTKSDDK